MKIYYFIGGLLTVKAKFGFPIGPLRSISVFEFFRQILEWPNSRRLWKENVDIFVYMLLND